MYIIIEILSFFIEYCIDFYLCFDRFVNYYLLYTLKKYSCTRYENTSLKKQEDEKKKEMKKHKKMKKTPKDEEETQEDEDEEQEDKEQEDEE